MPRTLIALLCVSCATAAYAKLGETVPQLMTRFGKNYAVETAATGEKYKFRSPNVSVDILLIGGVSVAETYFSDHPLNAQGEPPNDIVRAILRTNLPRTRWVETPSAPAWADYAIQSGDGKFVALLGYSRPQPENAKWTMVIGRRDVVSAITPRVESAQTPVPKESVPETVSPSEHPFAQPTPKPTATPLTATAEPKLASPPSAVRTPAPSNPAPARSIVLPVVAVAGTAVLYVLLLTTAFKRNTLGWFCAAAGGAIFFGIVCLLFINLAITRKKTAGRAERDASKQSSSSFDLNTIASDKELARYLRDQGEADTRRRQEALTPHVAEQIQRAVVRVTGVSAGGQFVGSGTGFFINADGYLLTCWHVIAQPQVTQLRLMRHDGSQCEVEGVSGFSARDDWVLLKTQAKSSDFLSLRATNADKPSFGTRILVFGNPGQLSGVWSEGAVADFVFNVHGTGRDSLRFDAPIAPGSSGSPLVDISKGDVVGIAAATGWPAGNYAVPFYYLTDSVANAMGSPAIPLGDFKAKLENEKAAIKQQIYDKENAGDLPEAEQLCAEFSARYPGDVWGSWEFTQIAFASDNYLMANVYSTWLQPAKDPGDDMLCAIKFECLDRVPLPFVNTALKDLAALLERDYGVEICKVQLPPNPRSNEPPVLNVRDKPDATSKLVYEFDADEDVFAKSDRARNNIGREAVIWRKVILLPSRDRIHGGEGWVNDRYISQLSLSQQ